MPRRITLQYRKRPKGKKLNRREKALIKASTELGKSAYSIEKETGISHTTVYKYMRNQEAYNNPKMKQMVAEIVENEILDLTVLNVRAKQRLHEVADRMNPIEAIALMDRTFQQRRLLEGKSTANIATLSKIIQEAHGSFESDPNRKNP